MHGFQEISRGICHTQIFETIIPRPKALNKKTARTICPGRLSFVQNYALLVECEYVEQVTDCGTVYRYIRIVLGCFRVGIVITAASCQWRQIPVPFDEFCNGNVIRISMVHVPAGGEWRDDDQWNTRSIAEEIQRLNIT